MDELWMLARRQLGQFTSAQAIQLVSRHELYDLAAAGVILSARRGVWRVAGAPETYEQAVHAALLAAGTDAWASHRTAAKLHGLLVPPPELIDVLTMPHQRMRLAGVAHHRNQLIVTSDVTTSGPISITSIARTLVDCMPFLPGRMLAAAVNDARRRKLVTLDDVKAAHAAVDEGRRTGRHLVRPMRPLLAVADLPGGSERELEVLRILRKAGLPLPVQQFPIEVAGQRRYLDYAYPERKLYLEFDGFGDHGQIREVFDDDRERDAELALLGWLGLHFTSRTTPADLVSRVERALEQRAA
jgi:very-short-patch-repair endonuclease